MGEVFEPVMKQMAALKYAIAFLFGYLRKEQQPASMDVFPGRKCASQDAQNMPFLNLLDIGYELPEVNQNLSNWSDRIYIRMHNTCSKSNSLSQISHILP